MATLQDIKKLHRGLQSDLRTPLGQVIKIEPLGDGRWERAAVGTPFLLHAIGERAMEFAFGTPVVALVPGRSAGEFTELGAPKSQLWVAWHEKWEKQPDQSFALLSAGWTVFWGQAGDCRKTKILRAEWFGKNFLDGETSEAAQPHWHVDPPLPLHDLPAPAPPPTGEFREIHPPGGPVRQEATLSVQEVHLAMGGWTNHEHPPLCWQLNLGEDLDKLRQWAVKTVSYLQTQAASFKFSVVDAEYTEKTAE